MMGRRTRRRGLPKMVTESFGKKVKWKGQNEKKVIKKGGFTWHRLKERSSYRPDTIREKENENCQGKNKRPGFWPIR